MKRLMALVLVAAIIVLAMLFFTNPHLLDKVWIWMVGLAGYVLILLEKGFKSLSHLFEARKIQPSPPTLPPSTPLHEDLQSKIDRIECRIAEIENKLARDKHI